MDRHYWFWNTLPHWFVGLAPMDGVTDLLYREIFALCGASPIVTEFTSAEWLAHNAIKLLRDFSYTQRQRPVVAQIFGIDPESFYSATLIACEMWFDGIDINMWCPSKNVASRGAGAGLIQTPDVAHSLIDACIAARDDFATAARSVDDLPIKNKMKDMLTLYKTLWNISVEREYKPISVKTRIGYNDITIEHWAQHLVQKPIAALTLHGRTFRQMYSGQADWDAIAIGAAIAREAGVIPVGNGDIQNKIDAQEHCQKYGTQGVLIGRASYGNPWIFGENGEATLQQKLTLAVWHSKQWEALRGTQFFFAMRKHLWWYLRGVEHASEFRSQLMLSNSSAEVESLFATWFDFQYDPRLLPFETDNETAQRWASAFGSDETDSAQKNESIIEA